MGDDEGGSGSGPPLTDRAHRILRECKVLTGMAGEVRVPSVLARAGGALVVTTASLPPSAASASATAAPQPPGPGPLRVTAGPAPAPAKDHKVSAKLTIRSSAGLCSLVDGGAWGAGGESATLAGSWSSPVGRKLPSAWGAEWGGPRAVKCLGAHHMFAACSSGLQRVRGTWVTSAARGRPLTRGRSFQTVAPSALRSHRSAPATSWLGLGAPPGLRPVPAWETTAGWGGKRGDLAVGAKWGEVASRVVLPGSGGGTSLPWTPDTVKAVLGGDVSWGKAGASGRAPCVGGSGL